MELDKISSADFKLLINQNLDIQFEPESILSAELIEISEFNGYSPLERKPFSIVFRTKQKTEYYRESTYSVEHPQIGTIPMFLSPKGFDAEGMRYEAVFS